MEKYGDAAKNNEVFNMAVKPEFQRQGLMRQMHESAETHFGPINPSRTLSDDGFNFWKSWRPSAVKNSYRFYADNLINKPVTHPSGEVGHVIGVGDKSITALRPSTGTTFQVPSDQIDALVGAAQSQSRDARATGGAISDAQKEAGNYKKDHLSFQGLPIAIENKKGSRRTGTDPNGKQWSCVIPADYGYIKRTTGADGDHVDCYIGPNANSQIVFVVDQIDPVTRRFDEHKCLLGFHSEAEARKTYDAGFSDSSGPKRRAAIHTMTMQAFKDWLKRGDTTKRIARAGGGETTTTTVSPGGLSSHAWGAPEPSGTHLHTGPIHSPVAGRTDHLPMHVPSGSYVIPADIISAMGEGNTMAGFKHMRRMFGGSPYSSDKVPYGGTSAPYDQDDSDQPYGASGGPYNEPLPGKAGGGEHMGSVPIVAAGGEYVLSPKEVMMAGGGHLETGHRVLDAFVKRMRAETVRTLINLPGPKKD